MVDVVKQDMNLVWASSGDIVAPDEDKITTGWGVEVVPRQWWNWMQNRVDTNVAYMLQKGIPEWDATTEYIAGKSYVQYQGIIYRAVATTTNVQPSPTAPQWIKAFVESSPAAEALKVLTPVADGLPYFTSGTVATQTTLTAYARTLLDDVDAAAMRSTLGLGSMALQNSNNITITGGSVTGITDIAVVDGGTGASTAAQARINLGTNDAANLTTGVVPTDRLNGLYNIGISGNAATATKLLTARNINGVAFDGTANITIFDATKLPLTGGTVTGDLVIQSGRTRVRTNGQGDYSTSALEVGAETGDVWLSLHAFGVSALSFQHVRGSNSVRLLDAGGRLGTFIAGQVVADNLAGEGSGITNLNAANISTGILPVARGGTGTSAATGSGAMVKQESPYIASPVLGGVPTADTAPVGTNTTQLATTAFVRANAAALPAGSVIAHTSSVVPNGFLKANGANVSRTTYAELFAVIGTNYGGGDGSTTFTLPDLRGEFIRGWDDGRGLDSGRGIGSLQLQSYQSHTHTASSAGNGDHAHTVTGNTSVNGNHAHTYTDPLVGNDGVKVGSGSGLAAYRTATNGGTTLSNGDHSHTINGTTNFTGAHNHTITVNASGDAETRPRNVALMYLIKF